MQKPDSVHVNYEHWGVFLSRPDVTLSYGEMLLNDDRLVLADKNRVILAISSTFSVKILYNVASNADFDAPEYVTVKASELTGRTRVLVYRSTDAQGDAWLEDRFGIALTTPAPAPPPPPPSAPSLPLTTPNVEPQPKVKQTQHRKGRKFGSKG